MNSFLVLKYFITLFTFGITKVNRLYLSPSLGISLLLYLQYFVCTDINNVWTSLPSFPGIIHMHTISLYATLS